VERWCRLSALDPNNHKDVASLEKMRIFIDVIQQVDTRSVANNPLRNVLFQQRRGVKLNDESVKKDTAFGEPHQWLRKNSKYFTGDGFFRF
jgi:hypothetical protein